MKVLIRALPESGGGLPMPEFFAGLKLGPQKPARMAANEKSGPNGPLDF